MLKIGLTGGIGSGKSTVARIFKCLNVPVYQADIEAKHLMNSSAYIRDRIIALLGEDSYEGKKINNKFIAGVVFDDPDKLKRLNEIVHPSVRKNFEEWAAGYSHTDYVIEEAAILFESGYYRYFDYTVFVSANKELRIKRVMERDGSSRESILKRMEQQWPEEEKRLKSNFIISNNEDDLILPLVLEIHNKFISLQQKNTKNENG